ncbi:hypothetical protein QTI17_15375 [Variovorax sp. J31P179]|uniref:hypothetical protein n=1 Tax=Variovorax sp. J31P179 TaxID=3053508 RepID=UPI002577CBCF|nr:hypothetical protein [Variovorax sp. J31P179]MDM0081976.1 hypothetical protein [Variovorax sp. J31P179]
MSYVVRGGRLSIVPIYDDVGYLIDGLSRLTTLDRSGIAGCLVDFFQHPPHAPLMALTSVLGLLLSAGAVWGPYLLNSVWVLFILGLGLIALRRSSPWVSVGILVATLAVPMLGNVLAEFRPDPVWGLLVGFAMIVCASTDVVGMRSGRLFGLGLLFGAAVIAKPTAAPASALVLAIGFATQSSLSLVSQRAWSTRAFIRSAALPSLGAACLIVPYFVSHGAAILAYVREVMGSESVWKTQASVWGHISFYLNRSLGVIVMGWVWYAAVPLFIACATLLVRARDRRALSSFAGIMAAVLTAYLIVTVSAVKSLMIGSILYGTIIAAVVWCLGQLATRTSLRGRAAILIGFLVFATQWVPRAGTIHREDPAMMATDEANRAVLQPLLETLRARPSAKNVLITVPGPVFAGTLDFLTRQQGVVRNFMAAYTWGTWTQFTHGVSAADVIVLSEAGMRGQGYDPSVRFQAELLTSLRASPDFIGRPVYTDEEKRSVWLFVRNAR